MKSLRLSLVTAFLATACLPALAGIYDPEKLNSHEFEIQKKVLEAVNQRVTPAAVAQQYRIQTPILPPRLDQNQVEALIAKEVEDRVEQQHPISKFQDIEVDAKKRFEMYKVGQLVSIRARDARRNVWSDVQGHIRQITPQGVRIADRFFIFTDVHESEHARFFKHEHDKAVEQTISNNTNHYKRVRQEFEQQMKVELSRQIWQAEGYVYNRSNGSWVAREVVFNQLYERAWRKSYEELRPQFEAEVYAAAGFAWSEMNSRWQLPAPEGQAVASDATSRPKASGTGAETEDSSVANWRSKLETLWQSNDKAEGEGGDLWDANDGKKGEGDDIWEEDDDKKATPPKKAAPKTEQKEPKQSQPTPAPKSDLQKEQENLFGDD